MFNNSYTISGNDAKLSQCTYIHQELSKDIKNTVLRTTFPGRERGIVINDTLCPFLERAGEEHFPHPHISYVPLLWNKVLFFNFVI